MPIPPLDREFENLEEAQEYFRKHAEAYNNTPQDELDGLSPLQTGALVYHPFGPESPLAWQSAVAPETLDAVPFLDLALRLLEQADTGRGIKLTATGNLPRKLVREWYDLGLLRLSYVEHGTVVIRSESDVFIFPSLRHTVQLSKLVKKRNGYLSTTATGRKLRAPEHRLELLQLLFTTHFQQFNLAYFDGYQSGEELQQFMGFYLRLLLRYGDHPRPVSFYTEKIETAFPRLLESIQPDKYHSARELLATCFYIRILCRFLWLYHLVEGELDSVWYPKESAPVVQTTPELSRLFTLR